MIDALSHQGGAMFDKLAGSRLDELRRGKDRSTAFVRPACLEATTGPEGFREEWHRVKSRAIGACSAIQWAAVVSL